MRRPARSVAAWLAAGLLAAAAGAALPDPDRLAAELAALGPRRPGTDSHQRARRLLLEAMSAAGLEEVVAVAAGGGAVNLSGVVGPGRPGRILLTAHYDTVPGSPGAADAAAGCAVAIATAAELARTPLARGVEVVLFDGEEEAQAGSRAWLDALPPAGRQRYLAAVNLDLLGTGRGARGQLVPAAGGGRRTPGWLVHAVTRGAAAAGWRVRPLDRTWTVPAQLVATLTGLALRSDADVLLAGGVPALTLSDLSLTAPWPGYHSPADRAAELRPGRLAGWARATGGAVRRLDALAGRPRAEDRYLAVFGRVWLRRDLYWLGFAVWVALVATARPGAWRRSSAAARRRRGQRYLPGFVWRVLYLVALLGAPAATVALATPAAALSLLPARSRRLRRAWIVAGALPAVLFAAVWLRAAGLGWAPWLPRDPLRLGLVLAVLVGALAGAGRPPPAPPGSAAFRGAADPGP